MQVISRSPPVSWAGSVIRKGQFVDESTQRQAIFIPIKPNSEASCWLENTLTASFPVRPIEDAMEVPSNSVFNSDEVFVVRQGRLAKDKINVVKENERTLIFNGLPEGIPWWCSN